MSIYIVSFRLNNPGDQHECLARSLNRYENWLRGQRNTWFVKTDDTAQMIMDYLADCLFDTDELVVVEVSGQVVWANYTDDSVEWLEQNLPT